MHHQNTHAVAIILGERALLTSSHVAFVPALPCSAICVGCSHSCAVQFIIPNSTEQI